MFCEGRGGGESRFFKGSKRAGTSLGLRGRHVFLKDPEGGGGLKKSCKTK